MTFKNVVASLICLNLVFLWFGGLYIQLGPRNVTVNAMLGFISIALWIGYRLSFLRNDAIIRLNIGGRKSKLLHSLLIAFFFISSLSYFYGVIDVSRYLVFLVAQLTTVIFMIAFSDVFNSKRLVTIALRAFLFGGILACSILFFDWVIDGRTFRTAGLITSGNPNYAANKILPVAIYFCTMLMLIAQYKGRVRFQYVKLYFLGSLISFTAIIITGSGGAFIALIATLLIAAFVSFGNFNRYLAVSFMSTLGLSLILFLSFPDALSSVTDRLMLGYAELRGEVVVGARSSILARVEIDALTLALIQENPLTGVGLGQASYYLNGFQSHNNYLNTYLELGPIGFLLMLFVIGLGIRIPAYSINSNALRYSIIAIAIHYLSLGGWLSMSLVILILFRAILWHVEKPR